MRGSGDSNHLLPPEFNVEAENYDVPCEPSGVNPCDLHGLAYVLREERSCYMSLKRLGLTHAPDQALCGPF